MTGVDLPQFEDVTLYPAVPLDIQRLGNVERCPVAGGRHLTKLTTTHHDRLPTVLLDSCTLPEARVLIRFGVDVYPLVI